jgi:hypothetical protein
MENEVLWHAWGMAEKRDGNYAVARKLLRRATEVSHCPESIYAWLGLTVGFFFR